MLGVGIIKHLNNVIKGKFCCVDGIEDLSARLPSSKDMCTELKRLNRFVLFSLDINS